MQNKEKSVQLLENTGCTYIIYLNLKRIIQEQQELCKWMEKVKPWKKK